MPIDNSDSTWQRLFDLSYPQLLLAVLTAVTVLLFVVAASSSMAVFGLFNPFWDGASSLQSQADQVGTESVVARETTQYTQVDPNHTVAIVLSPDRRYGLNDSRRVDRFVRRGGTLVVAEDFGNASNPLLTDLGGSARFNGSLLRDQRYNHRVSALPIATNVSESNITTGVENITLNHGTAIRPNGARVLVRSSQYSYLDLNRNGQIDDTERPQSYPVVTVEEHGDGQIFVVSDPSVFINFMIDRPGNKQFVTNLLLAHETVLLDYSHAPPLPPAAVALLLLREEVALQIGLGIVVIAFIWRLFRGEPLPKVSRDRVSIHSNTPSLSTEEIAAYLQRQHPDWDHDRVRRVTEGVKSRRTEHPIDE